MRQVHAQVDGSIAVQEVETPTPEDGQVLVRSRMAGICGSDTHAIAGGHPFLFPPYVPGHEIVGVVEAIAGDAPGLRPGMRVLLKPNVVCGECENCLAGRTNACQTLEWVGCDPSGARPGGMADYFVAPYENLFPLPDGVSDAEGVLVECLATPVHAVSLAGDLSDSRVVIIGAGTIGLLTVIAATNANAKRIVIIDTEEWKLKRAQENGAHAGVVAGTKPEEIRLALNGSADVVFDCVAHESTVQQSLELLRRAGSLYIVGVPPTPFTVNLPTVQDWEIKIQGCAAYTATDIETALRIAAAGGIPADAIITETYPLDDAGKAFESASSSSSGKVMVSCK